jgi:hypothetical protein
MPPELGETRVVESGTVQVGGGASSSPPRPSPSAEDGRTRHRVTALLLEHGPQTAADLAAALDGTAAEAATVVLPRRRRGLPRDLPERVIAAATALIVAGVVAVALVARDSAETAPVRPVPQRADPQEQARALAQWLRENSDG